MTCHFYFLKVTLDAKNFMFNLRKHSSYRIDLFMPCSRTLSIPKSLHVYVYIYIHIHTYVYLCLYFKVFKFHLYHLSIICLG